MNRLATCAVAIAALIIGAPAFAADMPMKAPPPPPAPVYNWTGWYAGVNLGASFGRVKTDFSSEPVTVLSPLVPIPSLAGSDISHPSGFIGGGQIGYNWQYSPLIVVGLEADIQGALEKDSAGLVIPFTASVPGTPPAIGTSVTNYTTKIDWFGTVRGRIGYLWGDGTVLTYVTGGLAYGKVELDATNTISGLAGAPFPFSTTHVINQSQINTGWVVGFGTEGKLLIPGWTYKIESLYMDLGDPPGEDLPTIISNASGGLITGHAHFTDAILRVGLNYQFH